MLSNISFCAKPIIHDYYPIEESAKKLSEKTKESLEKAYTRFDGINQEAKAERSLLKKQVPPEAGSNVHLKTKDLVEKEIESKAKAAVDSVNSTAAGDAYEPFSSF